MKNCRHSALALMLAFSMGALADPPTRTITRQPFDALSRKLDAANEAIQRVPELSAQIFKILLGKGSTPGSLRSMTRTARSAAARAAPTQ